MNRKYFISADIEGVTGVTSWEETQVGGNGYEEARLQMTKEVAAACSAILDAGCSVVVRDGHDSALNLIHRLLPKGTVLMRGWASHPGTMMALIDETYAEVTKALAADIPTRKLSSSFEMELSLKKHQEVTSALTLEGVQRVDVNTVKFKKDTVTEMIVQRQKIFGLS